MRKNRIFDMLDNSDDRIVDRLSVPVLPENEKERLLKMSKDKLDKMNNVNNDMAEEVSGVEKYKKPRWTNFATAAACIALVGGLAGGGVLLSRNSSSTKNNNDSKADSVKTTQSTTETTTETMTENVEYTTSAVEYTTLAAEDTTETVTFAASEYNDENDTIITTEGKQQVDSTEETSDSEVNMNDNGDSQDVSYVQLCKDLINNKWNELCSTESMQIIQFAFNDLDGDRNPEFLFKYGSGEYNLKVDVYAYRNGALKYISDIGGSHTSFGIDASTGKLVMIYGHMGVGEYDWYTMENDELKQIKTESFEYEYWGSNEQTTKKDILYASSGDIFSSGNGTATSYIITQSAIDVQPLTTEYDYFNLDIVDQLYSAAISAANNIPVK